VLIVGRTIRAYIEDVGESCVDRGLGRDGCPSVDDEVSLWLGLAWLGFEE
jgi:hypothetical protein